MAKETWANIKATNVALNISDKGLLSWIYTIYYISRIYTKLTKVKSTKPKNKPIKNEDRK